MPAGPPITTPGGHCHYLGGATTGIDGIRAAVREHAGRGVEVIKIMASGGNLTPGTHPELAQFSDEELRVAVDEAHRYSLPITAHAHGTPAIAAAVAAGVDGLEHVSFFTPDGVDVAPEHIFRSIVDRRVVLGATAGIAPVPGAGLPSAMASRLPRMIANFRRLQEAGASIVVGSDAGIGPMKPHDAVRHSVRQLTEIGISPADALVTITSKGAAVCGLGHRKGRVAPGFDADLLAVEGNPLADPDALHRIRAVFVGGILVPRAA